MFGLPKAKKTSYGEDFLHSLFSWSNLYQRFYMKYQLTNKKLFQNIFETAPTIYLLVIPNRLIPNNEQMNRQENRKCDCMNDRK